MLLRTHLAISVFFILLFFPFVDNKLVFVVSALFATMIPDIDSENSRIGRKTPSRILQLFTKHRGVIHSFSFLAVILVFLILFFPIAAFGFSLGYGLHLITDSFTLSGIRMFYPFKKRFRGIIKTGGFLEFLIFLIFLAVDLFLAFSRFSIF